jgi:hypothetical protein
MLIHIFWIFLCCMKIQYDFFIFWETWPYGWKQNILFFYFLFWRKPDILIPDLYFYSIKIQTNIDQNAIKNIQENHKFLLKRFLKIFLGWVQLGSCDWVGPSRPNRPVTWLGKQKARVSFLTRACSVIYANGTVQVNYNSLE